jgi:hypothetical protein
LRRRQNTVNLGGDTFFGILAPYVQKILVTLACAAPLIAGAETLYTKAPVEINAKETSSLLGKLSILTVFINL